MCKAMETQLVEEAVAKVEATVKEHFPELWPAVDVGLSVCASLLLADNVNPVAVVYVGPPSSGKTTIVNMFADHPLTYVSDKFTPASFVSSAANVSSEQLAKIDLLPRIKHKVLITPELAPVFRGKEEVLIDRFSTLTRVLDGQGFMTDSGTHGQRGYRGDYLFSWLGCTTPLDGKVWRIMAQLGSRLFFLQLDQQEEQQGMEGMLAQLTASSEGLPYNERLTACKTVIHRLLSALFDGQELRGIEWDKEQDTPEVQNGLMLLAVFIAHMRSGPTSENEEQVVEKESPMRAYAILQNIARGHALAYGRTQLIPADLIPVAQVALSTVPYDYGQVFRALVQHKELTVAQVKDVLGLKAEETAHKVMRGLERLKIVIWKQSGKGKTSFIYFTAEWEWCLASEWQVLFLGQPIDNIEEGENLLKTGGCEDSNLLEKNLAQRQNEREEKRETQHTQGPKNGRLDEKHGKTKIYVKKEPKREPPKTLLEKVMAMPIDEGMVTLRQFYSRPPRRHARRRHIPSPWRK
jgi:hypothetical protein